MFPSRHLPNALQVCILDGNKYASRCREEGEESWDILRDCMVLRNQRREPLLTSSACANDFESPQVRQLHDRNSFTRVRVPIHSKYLT